MIIGNGMMAKGFASYENNTKFLIFASGVSNSSEINQSAFKREYNLLKETIENFNNYKIVYFSTCSIFNPDSKDSQYANHKLNIENFISNNAKNYLIVRLTQIAGVSRNKNTLLNYLVHHVKTKQKFKLWKKAYRNIIDIDDVFKSVEYILENELFTNNSINIANIKSYPIISILHEIENFLEIKANCEYLNKGSNYSIDLSDIIPAYQTLGIEFDDKYLNRILYKYYD